MRTILTLSVVLIMVAACAPRPALHPGREAPYLLHVPAPGTDYRYRSGPQGFGRTGPVHGPSSYAPPPYGVYGQGHAPPDYRADPYWHRNDEGYAWSGRQGSVRSGYAYESREMTTEQTWVGGGLILEREGRREPHRAETMVDESRREYPGPYALAPRYEEPVYRPGPAPYRFTIPEELSPPPSIMAPPPEVRSPWPDAGPESFY